MLNYFHIKNLFKKAYYKALSKLLYSHFFGKFGKNSKIVNPLLLKNTELMDIGSCVTINDQVFMMVEAHASTKSAKLIIGDGCTIGNFNHIVALDRVVIGKNVLTADKVYISDKYHDYEDINLPVNRQSVKSKGSTYIGDGSWIGENVCIISSKIGKHCVIAANSVVTKDIPDYSVAAGAPAVIKKQYDLESKKWISVKKH
jgi:acetyltransferase-like isoleucine patch superfamily enzyme